MHRAGCLQPEQGAGAAITDFTNLAGQVDALLPPAPGARPRSPAWRTRRRPASPRPTWRTSPSGIRNNDALVAGLVATVGAESALTELTDRFYRNYVSTLVVVDEGVDRLMTALEASGELDDTLVVFTSDNGFHLGEHGLILRKATPYEESIRVPLLVRVPGAEAGGVVTTPVANVDVTATVLDWLDVAPGPRGRRHQPASAARRPGRRHDGWCCWRAPNEATAARRGTSGCAPSATPTSSTATVSVSSTTCSSIRASWRTWPATSPTRPRSRRWRRSWSS